MKFKPTFKPVKLKKPWRGINGKPAKEYGIEKWVDGKLVQTYGVEFLLMHMQHWLRQLKLLMNKMNIFI